MDMCCRHQACDPLELEVQVVVSCLMSAGNQILVLCECAMFSSLSSLGKLYSKVAVHVTPLPRGSFPQSAGKCSSCDDIRFYRLGI